MAEDFHQWVQICDLTVSQFIWSSKLAAHFLLLPAFIFYLFVVLPQCTIMERCFYDTYYCFYKEKVGEECSGVCCAQVCSYTWPAGVFSNWYHNTADSLHARLESLSLAMSHQDSNIKMVVWNHPYWTKALVEHLRELQNRCLYLWNRCFSFFQLSRTTPLWGIVALLASDILCSWYKYFRVHINGHWSCLCLPDEYLLE